LKVAASLNRLCDPDQEGDGQRLRVRRAAHREERPSTTCSPPLGTAAMSAEAGVVATSQKPGQVCLLALLSSLRLRATKHGVTNPHSAVRRRNCPPDLVAARARSDLVACLSRCEREGVPMMEASARAKGHPKDL
jgi:hypothetical protein